MTKALRLLILGACALSLSGCISLLPQVVMLVFMFRAPVVEWTRQTR